MLPDCLFIWNVSRNPFCKRLFRTFPNIITDMQRIQFCGGRKADIVENIVNISIFQCSRRKIVISCDVFAHFTTCYVMI